MIEGQKAAGERKLSETIRMVKNAQADREDVVVDMRDAERMRLELLASEMAPVFAEVPSDVDLFDFAISSGLQPRLWIDAVSHVAMGRDRRTYRFVRDTRLGRVVLAESSRTGPVADQVTRYIAERLVERQRGLDGDATPPRVEEAPIREGSAIASPHKALAFRLKPFASGVLLVATGGLVGLTAAVLLLWDKLALPI